MITPLASSKKPAPTLPGPVFGHLDICSSTGIHGWAYYKPDPSIRPTIVCFIDGKLVAQSTVNFHHADLQKLGLGDGHYGFNIDFPDDVIDDKAHLLDVKVRVHNQEYPLPGGTRLHVFERIDQMLGHVEINSDGLVHGWVFNKINKKETVRVVISAGPEHKLIIDANQYRPDLVELKLGTGYHGFQAVIPWAWYDACAHNGTLELTVLAERTETALMGSPLQLDIASSYKTRVEREKATEISPHAKYTPHTSNTSNTSNISNISETSNNTQTTAAHELTPQPLISVLMPVYNPPETYLEQAIESVQNQSYPHWQLCIADDASPNPAIRSLLQRYADHDPRIRVAFREKNGNISQASNTALTLVEGSHFALLDHDDLLHPDALLHIAHALQAKPDLGLLFSNEDKCTAEGQRFGPYFKLGWDRELLLSQNCVSHLGVFRTDLVRKLGGFRAGYEGSQDYDLALRASRHLRDDQILHIPRVLYHWRAIPGSTALANTEKSYAVVAMRKALQSHLAALNLKADIKPVQKGVFCSIVPKLPTKKPRLSVVWVVAQNTRPEHMTALLETLQWPNMQFLLALPENHPALPAELKTCLAHNDSKGFQYKDTLTEATLPYLLETLLEHAKGELCLCITAPVIPGTLTPPDWLDTLAAHALRKEVGFACPKLHDANLNVIDAGYKADPTQQNALTPLFTGLHAQALGEGGAAQLNYQTDAIVSDLFMARTLHMHQSLAAHHLIPGRPWHYTAGMTLKQRGKTSIVISQVLLQRETIAFEDGEKPAGKPMRLHN